jgi:phosphoribosyl-ATP pyrophosphohydrolase/phosphoribosyl-AMP cyclohydrolase
VSCFEAPPTALRALDAVIAERINEGADVSYTRRLASDRNLRLKKLGEESAELAVACADGNREQVVAEAADLLYHLLVAARCADVSLADIEHELDRRRPCEPARSRQAR